MIFENRFMALILVVAASSLILLARRSLLGDERALFANALENCNWEVRARIAAAVDRRIANERLDQRASWFAVAVFWVLGCLGFLGVVPLPYAFAISLATLVGCIAYQLLTIRRSGGSRVASLRHRRAWDSAAAWCFALPPLASAFGLWYGFRTQALAPVAVAVLASLAALAMSAAAAQAPAIVSDVDPAADELVDKKVRGSRIRQVLIVAAYAPLLATYATAHPHTEDASLLRTIYMLLLTSAIVVSNRSLKLSVPEISAMLERPVKVG